MYLSDLIDCFYDSKIRELVIAEYLNFDITMSHKVGTQSKRKSVFLIQEDHNSLTLKTNI